MFRCDGDVMESLNLGGFGASKHTLHVLHRAKVRQQPPILTLTAGTTHKPSPYSSKSICDETFAAVGSTVLFFQITQNTKKVFLGNPRAQSQTQIEISESPKEKHEMNNQSILRLQLHHRQTKPLQFGLN
jgi:hypothetical protein